MPGQEAGERNIDRAFAPSGMSAQLRKYHGKRHAEPDAYLFHDGECGNVAAADSPAADPGGLPVRLFLHSHHFDGGDSGYLHLFSVHELYGRSLLRADSAAAVRNAAGIRALYRGTAVILQETVRRTACRGAAEDV